MEFKYEIVRLYEEEQLSENKIARRLQIPASTVHYWLTKVCPFKDLQPTEKKRGRPRVTNAAMDNVLHNASLENPFMSAVDMKSELAPQVSADTIRRRLKEKGQRCRIPSRKPFLKEEHIYKRYNFAVMHKDWPLYKWEKVVFSDEKIFRASSKGFVRIYRPKKSDRMDPRYIYHSDNPAGRFTIAVWMAIGFNFKEIHLIERKTLDSIYYTEIILPLIEDHLIKNNLIFMQDLSSIHRSHLSKHWLASRNITWMEDWPPKGPDLNPVENVWAELVRKIRHNPTNKTQLWENVYEAYNELGYDYINNLIYSMPKRVNEVYDKEGGWLKY